MRATAKPTHQQPTQKAGSNLWRQSSSLKAGDWQLCWQCWNDAAVFAATGWHTSTWREGNIIEGHSRNSCTNWRGRSIELSQEGTYLLSCLTEQTPYAFQTVDSYYHPFHHFSPKTFAWFHAIPNEGLRLKHKFMRLNSTNSKLSQARTPRPGKLQAAPPYSSSTASSAPSWSGSSHVHVYILIIAYQ